MVSALARDCTLVPYTPDLDARIVRLQAHLWGDDLQRNAAYLKWKYTENPYLDGPLMQLAQHGGELIGMRGMFGTLWEVDDGERHLLPCADDFVIAPAHRNRGLAGRIMRSSLDHARRHGHSFAINLSAGPVTFIASLAAGWRSAGSYRPLERPRPQSGVRRRLEALVGARRLERAVRLVASRAPRTPFAALDAAGGSSPIAVARQPRAQAMADLVRRLPWDGRIRHVRDERYFSWRFRNPLHEYRFLFAGGADLEGYLVLQRYVSRWADPHQVNIADWEAVDDRTRADLLDAALRLGRLARVRAWSAGAPPTLCTLLTDRGFAPAETGGVQARSAGLLVCRLDARDPQSWRLGTRNMLAIADWDLRMVYSMAA